MELGAADASRLGVRVDAFFKQPSSVTRADLDGRLPLPHTCNMGAAWAKTRTSERCIAEGHRLLQEGEGGIGVSCAIAHCRLMYLSSNFTPQT